MGRSAAGTDAHAKGTADEQPEHTATVAKYYLNTFLVTVSRFRNFVNQYKGTPPAAGAGAHPSISGSGWQSAWNAQLPTSKSALIAKLKCHATLANWKDTPSTTEKMPINCVNWYVAFAFCTWSGGRLPTEAEWEYAAAGGSQNRLFPWGSAAADKTRASYYADGKGYSPKIDVGSYPADAGRWGNQDLAGSMWEWNLDWNDWGWYSGAGKTCNNCAKVTKGTSYRRTLRGGHWYSHDHHLRAAARYWLEPHTYYDFVGIRCARNKP